MFLIIRILKEFLANLMLLIKHFLISPFLSIMIILFSFIQNYITIVITLLIGMYLVFISNNGPTIIIEEFSVADSLCNNGITSLVITRRIKDAINEKFYTYDNSPIVNMPGQNFSISSYNNFVENINVDLKLNELSLKSIELFFRELIGAYTIKVNGEFIKEKDKTYLIFRIQDNSSTNPKKNIDYQEVKNIRDFQAVIEKISQTVVREYDPMALAQYAIRKGDFFASRAALIHAYTKLKSNEDSAKFYNILGYSYLEEGRLNKAKDEFLKSLSFNKKYIPALLNYGVVEIKNNNPEEALRVFKLILSEDKNHVYGNFFCAQASLIMNDTTNAFNYYSIALNNGRDITATYEGMANYYLHQNNYKNAIEYFKKAIYNQPKKLDNYIHLANSYAELKMFDEFDEAMFVCNQSRYFSDLYYKAYGYMYKQKNNMIEAENFYKKALSLNPGDQRLLLDIASFQINRGEKDSSKAILLKLKTTHFQEPWLIEYALGIIEYNNRNYYEAINYFSSAIKMNTKYSDSYKSRGESLLNIGKVQDACNDFRKYNYLNSKDTTIIKFMKMCN